MSETPSLQHFDLQRAASCGARRAPLAPPREACRRRTTEAGISARCEFLIAYVDALPSGEPDDAATSILVSHSITDRTQRVAFYRGLSARLRLGGWLVTANLTTSPSGQDEDLHAIWQEMMRHTGPTEGQIRAMLATGDREVALLTTSEMARYWPKPGLSPW